MKYRYKCPDCGKVTTISTKSDHIKAKCSKTGNKVKLERLGTKSSDLEFMVKAE